MYISTFKVIVIQGNSGNNIAGLQDKKNCLAIGMKSEDLEMGVFRDL